MACWVSPWSWDVDRAGRLRGLAADGAVPLPPALLCHSGQHLRGSAAPGSPVMTLPLGCEDPALSCRRPSVAGRTCHQRNSSQKGPGPAAHAGEGFAREGGKSDAEPCRGQGRGPASRSRHSRSHSPAPPGQAGGVPLQTAARQSGDPASLPPRCHPERSPRSQKCTLRSVCPGGDRMAPSGPPTCHPSRPGRPPLCPVSHCPLCSLSHFTSREHLRPSSWALPFPHAPACVSRVSRTRTSALPSSAALRRRLDRVPSTAPGTGPGIAAVFGAPAWL